ncbi:unnamed protein product [Prorocentrum cordatum]|uniref:Uncharacterized protein n=1 Tax=Prorocentrum cordatum TaxID=2364126 RepID=A0ABN9QSI2_9DINO|nr:unnamed protein product [Polarella glacialis]
MRAQFFVAARLLGASSGPQVGGCTRRPLQVERTYPVWANKFPIDHAQPKLGTWLDSKRAKGLGAGCKICRAAGFTTSPFGAYEVRPNGAIQVCSLQKHAQCAEHKAAVAAFLAGNLDVAAYSVMRPKWDEFKQVADDIVAGGSLGHGTIARRRILRCLKEALCADDREALKPARAISLFRDERKGRLAVRYRAVNQNLDEFSGTLGQERDFGTGATKIMESTFRIIERMCTKFSDSPRLCRATPASMPSLMAHVRESVMCITVDSAGDELLASEMMCNQSLAQTERALTPNLKFVLRDSAHASRRIISRPWNADPYLRDVAMMMAQGRSSVAKLVQNSTETSRVFAGYVKSSQSSVVTSAIRNMQAASHRFEYWQKPLGRTALFMHASIETAMYVANRPAKDENTDKAKAWLAWVDSERCLMLAMMADVADEGMCLTRLLDNEDVGTACLNSEVLLFIRKVEAMFGESERCLTIFGYTSVMMNLLNEYVVWHVNDDSRSIGFERGVPGDIVNRCMERMRSYVVLARAALAAEFPSFEMSQAADINPTRLQVQWEHGFPRARQQQQRGLSNKEAWRYVIQKLGQQRLALRHDIDDLRSALVAYVAFGMSTSGVEQKFSLAALKFNCRQLSSDARSEDMFLKIALDLPNRDLNKVIDSARRIWLETCGRPVVRKFPRVDKGVKRPRTVMKEGEAEFIRQRRKAARLAVSDTVAGDSTREVGPGSNWGATHQKELDFLKNKHNTKRCIAYSENVLLPQEVTHAVCEDAAAKHKKQLADQLARSRKTERARLAALGAPTAKLLEAIRGKPVFVDIPCRSPGGGRTHRASPEISADARG